MEGHIEISRAVEDRIRALPCWTGRIEIAPLKGGISNESYLVSDVRCAKGLCAEEGRDHEARLGILHLRAEAGSMGGSRGHQLAVAENVVEGIIPAEAHDMAPRPVAHKITLVADAALQRRDLDAARPAGQKADAVFDGATDLDMSLHQLTLSRMRLAAAEISRSAMMAMKAIESPATMPRPVSALVSAI